MDEDNAVLQEALEIAKNFAIRLHPTRGRWRVPRAKFNGAQMDALFANGWSDAKIGNSLVAPDGWDPGSLVF